MPEAKNKFLPSIAHQTPNILDQSDVMSFMPNADFFLWFTPVASKLAIVVAITPIFLCALGAVGVLNRLIFPLTIAYINALKPFLQLTVSDQFAPMMTGMTNLVYCIFGLVGLAVMLLTIRILRNENSLCLTVTGISLGTSSSVASSASMSTSHQLGSLHASSSSVASSAGTTSIIARNQVIYQESRELNFKDVSEIEIVRPKTTKSNLDYLFVFSRGSKTPFKIRYGDILKANERANFVAAIKERFGDRIDDEMLEPFEIAGEKQSYTELWLKELSASPKRDKLTPLEVGAQVHNGRYTIISKIGMGGQGTVYLAQDNKPRKRQSSIEKLQRTGLINTDLPNTKLINTEILNAQSIDDKAPNQVVMKEALPNEVVLKEFLLPVFPDSRVRKAAAVKFQEEADLLGKLEHPQIVKFFELFLEDHRAYLVLEKLEGVTLKEYVETQGSMPQKATEDLAHQMCEILQYLHNQTPPVVHRDFTPDNLILSEDGRLKLLDFSVAQSVTSNVTGSVVGKPHYIAPEQFRGKSCSQSDIYSMGATLFFLATGNQPEPITNQKQGKTENLKSSKLGKIIEKSTKLDLASRYKKVEEILMDLG